MKKSVASLVASLAFPALPVSLLAQSTWDAGGGGDLNWSTFTNWSTDASPAGTAVVFGAAGTTANTTTVGNIVDQSMSVSSLTYGHTSTTAWHVTQINSGSVLTVGGAFRVGTTQVTIPPAANPVGLTTLVTIMGAGGLVVDDAASAFTVAGNVASGSNREGRATLDMSASVNSGFCVCT